ncbi:type II secretion system F family protein [Streptomyces sp. t39]|uniref:type II secretion system F family protein n=1 Tax=Streptomyces sp. t39 TaxID=1828156 RepID=UPI0011CD5DA4|nr:type II secretion system F family protein [Streptomyces sp. t39]TXS56182.1 type II secretion protein F [Streptomyces sp. t39]
MTTDLLQRLAAVLAGLTAVGCLGSLTAHRRARAVRKRVGTLLSVEPEQRRRRPEVSRRVRSWGAPFGAALICCVLFGGVPGAAAGVVAGAGVRQWLRRKERAAGAGPGGADDSNGAEALRQLPLAADLLAACISAGAGPREAAEAVGASLGGPVGARLTGMAAHLRLGREPAEAWEWFGRTPGAAPLARCLERADTTGAPAAEPMARLAERYRADRARRVTARGRRAQVLITAPVGLCFLPAFLAVGVAPVVIGLAGGLLTAE